MNNVGGALNFNAVLNLNDWRRNVDQIKRDLLDLNKNTKKNTRDMDSYFKDLSVGIASYFSINVVKDFISELINVRGEFQQMENAIETITGSTKVMNGLMDEWKDLTLRSPFRLSEIGQAGKQLLAYGISVDKVTHDIEMLGNVAAGVSAPIGDIAYVYGTLKTQGRAYTRDILQFTQRGIPIMGELAKVMGVSVSEMKDLIEAGKVGFPEVEKAMNNLTSEGGKFNNLIGKQATTLTGSVNRLKHEFELMLNDIGAANEGILKGGIDAVTHLIENYKEVGRVLLTLIEIYGIYRVALLVTTAIQKASIAIEAIKTWLALAKSIRTAADAQALFNLTSNANPYVLIITAIGALIAITYNYREELGEMLGIIDDTTNAQRAQQEVMQEYHLNFSKNVNQTKATISELINTIKNESSTMDMRKAAYERLIKIDESFRGVLDAQYKATNRLGEALAFVTQKIDAFAMAQAKASASKKILEQSFEAQFERDAVKVQIDAAKAEAKKWRDLELESRRQGKGQLEYLRNAKKYEDEVAKLEKELVEKRKIANERTGVSNAIIRSNNKEVNDASKNLEKTKKQIAEYKKLGKDVSQLEKNREKLENFLNGFKPVSLITEDEESPQALGWAGRIKKRIKEIEDSMDGLSEVDYRKAEAEIKRLNDLLHPPKQAKDKQWAEIIPEGSIKELERRVQLYVDAIETAVNGQVKLRKLDKYGKDKDKKGNPLLTGEIVSIAEAKEMMKQTKSQLDALRKQLETKTFDEEISDLEMHWKIKYKIAASYGEDIAKVLFPNLKGESYYDDINKKFKELNDKQLSGVKLSDEDLSNWNKLKEILSSLNGTKDPLTNFRESLEKELSTIESSSDKIDLLTEKLYHLTGEQIDKGFKSEIINQLDIAKNQLNQTYETFIKEKETFEQRKANIDKKYNEIRNQIQKSNVSDEEKTRLTSETNKDQAKEISSASFEAFKKTDLWVKAFGDLDKIGPKTLTKLKKGLEEYLKISGSDLKNDEIKITQDQIKKLNDLITSNNPYKAIGIAVSQYKKKREELNEVEKKSGKNSDAYKDKLEETQQAFVNIVEVTGAAAKATVEVVGTIGDAFGGLSDELKQTLAEVQQLIDGIVNTVAGYFTNNYGQMISGIVQMVSALTKLLNGDVQREKNIKEWQRSIEDLKTLYQELQYQIEKTAGAAQLDRQRDLISNLKQQQQTLEKMLQEEGQKKKPDEDKMNGYRQQISSISLQIEQLVDDFKKSITTTDFKDLSQSLAEALTEAFGQGEDAVKAFDKVVDDVMRNAVQNALKIKILEPAVQQMVDSLYNSMGFGNGAKATPEQEAELKKYKEHLAEMEQLLQTENPIYHNATQNEIEQTKNYIKALEQQIASNSANGTFDGLTQEERDKIKAMGTTAMQQYMAALEQYKDLFGESAENAQGLKGDIKGITEKTAGALEAQINAMRINVAEVLKIHRENQLVFKNQLLQLTQIEINTRPLKGIFDQIKELNSKVKGKLAGIP